MPISSTVKVLSLAANAFVQGMFFGPVLIVLESGGLVQEHLLP